MKTLSVMLTVALLSCFPCLASGEEQVTDRSGRVIEIRQVYGNTSYAYNGNRSPIYTATKIQGGRGPSVYRDSHGGYVGVGGPGTLPWSVPGKWLQGIRSTADRSR